MVFRQLKQLFNDKPSYVAMHSVQLTSHPNKRFGEIDFLLCTNMGLFVLEVKGGQVSCHNGVWYYKDKHGNQNTGGSPFHQANDAMQGLRQCLLKKFDQSFVNSICFGYGVILTDSQLPDDLLTTLEYDRQMLCQGGEHLNLQKWLDKFFIYWQHRNKEIVKSISNLADEDLQKIIQFIRPNFQSQTEFPKLKKDDLTQKNLKQDVCIGRDFQDIESCLLKYYEKMVNDDYIMAKDISILIDNVNTQTKVMELLKKLRMVSRVFDEYSFNFRKSYEISLLYYEPQMRFNNKIVIAVLKNLTDEQEIGRFATHGVEVFYD